MARQPGHLQGGQQDGSLLLDPGRLAVDQASTELSPDSVVPAEDRGPGEAREVHHDRRPGPQTGDRPVALCGTRPDPAISCGMRGLFIFLGNGKIQFRKLRKSGYIDSLDLNYEWGIYSIMGGEN